MRVFTITCADCGTIVAANELERHREMHCPGLDCDRALRFTDLPEDAQGEVLENPDRYRI